MLCVLEYVDKQNKKYTFQCQNGHTFERNFTQLKYNSSCPICKKEEQKLNNVNKFKELVKKANFEYIDGYQNKKSKVTLRCKQCGSEFRMQADSFVKNQKCPICKYQASKEKPKHKTIEEIAKENNIEIIEYVKGKTSVSTFKCSNGHIFKKNNKSFRERPYCNICKELSKWKEKDAKYRKMLNEHGWEVITSELIKNNSQKIVIRCTKCGDVVETSIGKKYPSFGCKNCRDLNMSQNKRLSKRQLIKDLNNLGFTYIEGDYKNNNSIITVQCENGHTIKNTLKYFKNVGKCTICNPSSYQSQGEKEIIDFIKSFYNGEIIERNKTLLNGNEIDIYLPEVGIGIEYNGEYFHSEELGKGKNYHLNKTKKASEKGVQLIHIFESEWFLKKDRIKNFLKDKIAGTKRIGARKCNIVLVDKNTEKDFFNKYHIDGFTGSSICIGLEYDGKLMMAISFAKPRYNKNYDYELIRMATICGYTIIGGISKIINYFFKNTNARNLISYANIRFSNFDYTKTGYFKAGFTHIGYSEPNYFYFKPAKVTTEGLLSRQKFQKHKLFKMDFFDPNLSEKDIVNYSRLKAGACEVC